MKPTCGAAQLGELLVVQRGEVGLADVDGAAGERVEAGEAVHQRALAGAGRAHDRGEPAGLERDGDAVEGAHLAVALAVDLRRVDGAGSGASWRGGVGSVMTSVVQRGVVRESAFWVTAVRQRWIDRLGRSSVSRRR